jgi:DNA invertase Pin-like site-specific DNA recombinase
MIIGYARVSTNDQDLSSQLDELKQAGATKIYREKISGARSDRPELAKLMRSLGPGRRLKGRGRLQKPRRCLGRYH